METGLKPSWIIVRGYVRNQYLSFWLPGRLKLYDSGPNWYSEYGIVRISTGVRDDDIFFEKMMFIFYRVKWKRRVIEVPIYAPFHLFHLRFQEENPWIKDPMTSILIPREGKYERVPEVNTENILRFAHGEELL